MKVLGQPICRAAISSRTWQRCPLGGLLTTLTLLSTLSEGSRVLQQHQNFDGQSAIQHLQQLLGNQAAQPAGVLERIEAVGMRFEVWLIALTLLSPFHPENFACMQAGTTSLLRLPFSLLLHLRISAEACL